MPETTALRPAVFLDRDGTIVEEVGYLSDLSRFRLLPGVADAIRRLNEASMPVFVVTNQSGVGRGYFPESFVHSVYEVMAQQLAAHGAHLDGIYYCPHTPEDVCECRKPKTGMLERASRDHAIDLRKSYVVGDRYLDVELGQRVGAWGILVRTGYGNTEYREHSAEWARQPACVAADLTEAVDWILRPTR